MFPLRGPRHLEQKTPKFLGIYSISLFKRVFTNIKKTLMDGHLHNISLYVPLNTTSACSVYVYFNIHLNQPPSESTTPLLPPKFRTPKPEYISTNHQHIRPSQHNISTYVHLNTTTRRISTTLGSFLFWIGHECDEHPTHDIGQQAMNVINAPPTTSVNRPTSMRLRATNVS